MLERSKGASSTWLWVLGGLIGLGLVVLVLVVGPWLFTRDQGLTPEQELSARNDVRGTLVQALGGLALAGGLIVTYRTYRQNRVEQDRTYALRQAEQVNQLFAKAVEQLGSDSAPVRLGALYALEHLAQDNPDQRPMVVDVFCAYLRMPYDVPGDPPDSDAPDIEQALFRQRWQELEVRLATQGILAEHLKPADERSFWNSCVINLSGAVLINLDFGSCRLTDARFIQARFRGLTIFHDAIFVGDANFAGAKGDASTGTYIGEVKWYWAGMGFDGAQFLGEISFYEASFRGGATFKGATFHKDANFAHADFGHVRQSKIFPAPERPDVDFQDARVAGASSGSTWPDGWGVLPDEHEPGWGVVSRMADARTE